MAALEELALQKNSLIGPLPASWGEMSALRDLRLL